MSEKGNGILCELAVSVVFSFFAFAFGGIGGVRREQCKSQLSTEKECRNSEVKGEKEEKEKKGKTE